MSRRTFVIALLIGLCLSLAYISWHNTATAFSLPYNQTVPTRTPTGAPATATEPPDNGGSPGNTPAPTNTPGTIPTATPLPVTLAATQEGLFVATAVACGGQPTVQALNTTYVRGGPGTDYEIVNSLVYLEVRPIVGRAADAAWWLIELSTGERGWIADDVVDVRGYIAIVPIAVSPPIGLSSGASVSPTPGPTWKPTPLPTCTVTPTSTATATPPTTDTATATVSATREPTAVATATPTATPVPPTATITVAAQAIAADAVSNTPEPTAAPLDVETTTGAANLLPIAALVLLVAGVAVILVRRRDRST